MSQLYDLYKAVGKEAFSREVMKFAPYFATIDLRFLELRPNLAEVFVENRPEVRNHIGTVHAIAMCNAAEAAAAIMCDVSIPETSRWIPIGINARYLAKATTDITAVATGDTIDWEEHGNKDIPVSIRNTAGEEVCSVVISVYISQKKA